MLLWIVLIASFLGRPAPPSHFIDTHGVTWRIERRACRDMPKYKVFSWSPYTCFEGFTDDEDGKHDILIMTGLPFNEERDCLMHELMHVCAGTIASDDVMDRHHFIYDTSPCIAKLLRRNPAMSEYFGK